MPRQDMEEKESFLTLIRRVRTRTKNPKLIKKAISLQRKLIKIIRGNDLPPILRSRCRETPESLAYVSDLLNSGVDALAPDYNLQQYNSHRQMHSPLHIAVLNGLPKVTKLLLKIKGHPNVAGSDGWTAAHLAADAGRAECLKVLIDQGADVNATTKRDTVTRWISGRTNSTPLCLAAWKNHPQCVRLLLDHGANVNAMDSRQQSPLYIAASWGYPECLMMMLQHSSDCPAVFTPTDTQETVLSVCFRHGEKMRECIEELVHRGADVGPHDLFFSAVHEAVFSKWDLDMMKLLILEGCGMDFDSSTESRSPLTSLMYKQLLNYCIGANHKYTDLDESTALLFLRMGATRRELKEVLWCELNLPKQPGVLLETLMDSFSYLPSMSELEAEDTSRYIDPDYTTAFRGFDDARWVCSGTLWHRVEEGMTEEAIRQKEESLKAIVDEKKRYYHQYSREVPSLLHLNRAAIRSNLQADVRKVISWPVPQCVKRYILLDHVV